MSVPIGVQHTNGDLVLNPSPAYVMDHGDAILFIAEDDDSYVFASSPHVAVVGVPVTTPEPPPLVEKVLLTGWRRDIRDPIVLLDTMLAPGSEVLAMCPTLRHFSCDDFLLVLCRYTYWLMLQLKSGMKRCWRMGSISRH